MTQQEFDDAKRRAYYAPKGFRVSPIIAPDGKRWKWIAGRRYWAQVDLAKPPEPFPLYKKSESICRNRNLRRLAYGYKDIYSMRERGWPTAYRKREP